MMRFLAILFVVSIFRCGSENEKNGVDIVRAPVVIRLEEESCDTIRSPGIFDENSNEGCTSDEECTSGDSGRCRWVRHSETMRICTYDVCYQDEDCANGEVCSCGNDASKDFYIRSDANACVKSSCVTSDDCGGDNKCKANLPCGNGRINGYFCETGTDSCSSDMDCDPGFYCIYQTGTNRWSCGAEC